MSFRPAAWPRRLRSQAWFAGTSNVIPLGGLTQLPSDMALALALGRDAAAFDYPGGQAEGAFQMGALGGDVATINIHRNGLHLQDLGGLGLSCCHHRAGDHIDRRALARGPCGEGRQGMLLRPLRQPHNSAGMAVAIGAGAAGPPARTHGADTQGPMQHGRIGMGRSARAGVLADPPVYAGIPPDMPTVRLGSDPNGVVRNASQGFGSAACQVIVNAGENTKSLNGGRVRST